MTALSINFKDAGRKPEELKRREVEYAIHEVPSLVDYFGYMYFCGGPLMGPFFEYKDYKDFIQLQGKYSNIPANKTLLPALAKLFQGIIFIVLIMNLEPIFGFDYMLTKEFIEKPIWYKHLYMIMTFKTFLYVCVVGFKFMDAGTTATGLGYDGKDTYDSKKCI
eukprot:CAMPEP_0116877348 /NCGR_PEP_ID=MMETSP0463-20121206/9136_1 /TAXON_ID=181622 /ORGANISM="Strombidinopsis sp, Strain SopsisLIS2011" /LENGTH=163 /DNA_ID=CAMNT_0004524555 /DNA_START=317 /DNA_END=808 /DNA_ORIENTATION=+